MKAEKPGNRRKLCHLYLKKTYSRMIHIFMYCLAKIICPYLTKTIKLLWLLNGNLMVFCWYLTRVTLYYNCRLMCLRCDVTIESFQTFKWSGLCFLYLASESLVQFMEHSSVQCAVTNWKYSSKWCSLTVWQFWWWYVFLSKFNQYNVFNHISYIIWKMH